MGSRKRVYVSSTFVDLQSFRKKVLERLRGSNSITVAMEDYPAFDERPPDKCLADIANCDIYVGILAKRYGYVPEDNNPEGLSITEMEYRKAGDAGLMRLMFQLDPEEPWLGKFDDKATGEGDAGKRIDRFRTEVFKRHGVRMFRSPDELAGLVLEAILATLQTDSSGSISPLLQQSYRWPAAWDFELYMAEKRGTFVGRDWLFRDIAGWLDAGLPRALLLRADFGVGKSAMMAELIYRNPGSAIAAWHFCQSDTHETLHPATFVRSLAAQLKDSMPGYREAIEADAALQERLDKALIDPASAFEAAILTPLSKLEAPASHRLLVIDALDETLELDREVASRFGTLVKLVADRAGRFPAWLRILATSRNNPQVVIPLQQAFGLKEIDAESTANQEDLRLYIMTRCTREPLASRLHGSGHSAEHVTAVLSEKSLGKFLYAVRALKDLENGTIDANDLIHLAPGMDSFYLGAFERRFGQTVKDYTPVRDMLGVLAVAREPLSLAMIAEILGQSEAQVKAVRNSLPDFLRLRGGRLTFDHFSIAEWLSAETEDGFARAGDYAIDVPASEARLHGWALRKVSEGKAHTSEYLVRHLASHLPDKSERQNMFSRLMLSHPEWLAARLRLSGIEALIADCDQLGEISGGALLLALFRNNAHVLKRFPDQLPTQLLGRIRSLRDPANPLAELANNTLRWLEHQPIKGNANRLLVPTTGSLRFSGALIEILFTGNMGDVTGLAVLPDGYLVTGADDGSVRVWDTKGGHEPQVFEGHTGAVRTLAVLSDGRIASGAYDSSVRVWDPQGRHEPQVFEGHTGGVNALAVLPDGCVASGAGDGSVRVWDPQGRYEPRIFEGHMGGVSALAVLPDGCIASGAYDGSVRVWDPQGRHKPQLFAQRTDWVRVLVVLLDGRIASGADDGSVRVWDPQGRDGPQVFKGNTSAVRALAVLPDGCIASGAYDGSVRVWDPQGRHESQVFEGHTRGVTVLAVLLDGAIASGAYDGSVRIWDPQARREPQVFKGHTGGVRALAVLPDGRLASGAYDGSVRIWDPQGRHESQVFGMHIGRVTALAVLPDGRIASGAYDGSVRVWDPQGRDEPQVFGIHIGRITALAVLPDGRMASGAYNGSVRVWDPQGRDEPQVFEGHTDCIRVLAVLPDGRIASGAANGSVRVWDPQGRHGPQVLEGPTRGVTALAVLSDGHIASGAYDGSVRVWDSQGRDEPHVFEGHTDWVGVLAELPDRCVASGAYDGSVRVWDRQGRHEPRVFEGHTGGIRVLAVLPDGRVASGADDGSVRVWDPSGRHEPQVLTGHTGGVRALVLLPDGRIVSGADDGSVRVWDAVSGQGVALFVADAGITALLGLCNNMIVAGDEGGAVHFLRLIG